MKSRILCFPILLVAACGAGGRAAPPVPAPATAPVLSGQAVMVFPVQHGLVPVGDTAARHYPIDADVLNAEIAYWLPELAGNVRWILPAAIQRAVSRSPTLGVDINRLDLKVDARSPRSQVLRVIGQPRSHYRGGRWSQPDTLHAWNAAYSLAVKNRSFGRGLG